MDNRKNLLLLLFIHINAFQCFSGSTVRADQRLIIYSGKSRRLMVYLTASWADFNPGDIRFFHGTSSYCFLSLQPNICCQIRNSYNLPYRWKYKICLEVQTVCPRAWCTRRYSASGFYRFGFLWSEAASLDCNKKWESHHSDPAPTNPHRLHPTLQHEPGCLPSAQSSGKTLSCFLWKAIHNPGSRKYRWFVRMGSASASAGCSGYCHKQCSIVFSYWYPSFPKGLPFYHLKTAEAVGGKVAGG